MIWKYILNGHTPVPCENVLTWAEWFENAATTGGLTVKRTEFTKDNYVSTVFLAIDPGMGTSEKPKLFETMIFGGPHAYKIKRSETWEEALVVHEQMVALNFEIVN